MSPEEFAAAAAAAQTEFAELCEHRYKLGEEKYGPGKWMTVDTMNEALFELADLANYAMFSFIRIRLLQQKLEALDERTTSEDFTKDLG
jgi:hypothetical protein